MAASTGSTGPVGGAGTVGDDSNTNSSQVTSPTSTPGTQSGSGTVQAPADSATPLRARSSSPSAASSLANAEGSTSGQAHIPLSAEEIALEERINAGGSAAATRSEAAVAIALTQVLLQYQGRASFLLGGGSSAADDLAPDNLPVPVTQAAAPTQGVALVSASSGSAGPRAESPDEVIETRERQDPEMAPPPERPATAEQNQSVRQSTERKVETPPETKRGAPDQVLDPQAQAEGAGLVVEPVGEGVSGIGQGLSGLLDQIESWVGESTPTRVAAFLSPVLTAAMGAFAYGAVRRRRKKAAAAAAVAGPLGPDTDTWLPGDSDLPSVDPS